MSKVSRKDAIYHGHDVVGPGRYVCKLQKFSTDMPATLQRPVRCKQAPVDDRCNGKNASNDSAGPGWWSREQPDQIAIKPTHEVRKCAKDCLVSECTTKMGEMS